MIWPIRAFQRDRWIPVLTQTALALVVIVAVTVTLSGCASKGSPETTPAGPEASGTAPGGASAPGAPAWLARTTTSEFQPHKDPAGRISIDYPREDWRIVPGGSTTVASFTQNDGEATVVLEQTTLNQALGPNEVTEVFGEIEVETIKQRDPQASNFNTRLMDEGGRRVVGIQYERSGPQGAEVVRQYSFPVAKTLYRLTCVMKPNNRAEHEPICSHMAASFKPITQ